MRHFLLFCVTLAVALPMPASTDILREYRWKNRLILFSLPEEVSREARSVFLETLAAQQEGITDRNLILIDLSLGTYRIERTTRPDPDDIALLREAFEFDSEVPQFALVGKDGGIKGRKEGELDLEEWFARIDTMPMRQREMRDRNR